MTDLRISIVTPNFNMASYLDETIRSVLANRASQDEYFVIDGGSTDGSVDLIRRHAADLTGWISEPDRGYPDALAKGFACATGDVLCWINSGDVLLSGTFDAVRRNFATGDVDLIFGDDFYIDENSRVLRFSRGHVRDIAAAMLYGGWTPLQDACFWTRDVYDGVGGIDRQLRFAADYDLFLRMARAGRTRHVSLAFSAFRRHKGQKSIADHAPYAREREQVRAREFRAAVDGPLAGAIKRAVHLNINRMRSRIAPKIWRRPDLTGRPIAELPCASYWPRTSDAG
jgi:glycosyltransferase involved in cell wall biosynthesis